MITTIKQLPNTDTLSDTDLFLCFSGGKTKNITWGQVKAMIEGKKGSSDAADTIYTTNYYVTNLFSTTWITNDFVPARSQAHKAIEAVSTVIPKPVFSASQWGMILFGAIISIICIARIYTALRWNK